MKVLHITAAYKPAYVYGGPTMSVSMVCEELKNAGLAVAVFTTTANGKTELHVKPGEQVKVEGVNVTYFKRLTKDHTHFSPALLKALNKHIKSFDIVHIHGWWNLVSILSCFIAVIKKVPVIVSPRGMLSNYSFTARNFRFKSLIHQFLGKLLLQKSYVHVTSESERDAVNQLIRPIGITVVPNFVKLSSVIDPHFAPPDDEMQLLFFSRIEEKKGLNILIDALPDVSIPYQLTIAGDGDPDYVHSLKALATRNKVGDKITWVGFYGDNKFELLQKHHLMILPSYDENFGNVVIESLSVGTAVLISNQVGLAAYVRDHQLGWVCDNTPSSLAAKLNEIGKMRLADLQRINKVAPLLVRRDFTGTTLTEKYVNFYKSTLLGLPLRKKD